MKDLSKTQIAKLIKSDNPLILDVGCYDGRDGAGIAVHFDRCEVHCFEADPRSAYLFMRLYGQNKKLHLHQYALTDVDGEVEFYQSDSKTRRHFETQTSWSASSSIRKPKTHLELFTDVYFENKIKVRGMKLDTWFFRDIHLYDPKKKIDFVWCDVNGGEGDFIRGGIHALNEYTKFLYIESSDKELYEGQITKDELLLLLPAFDLIGEYNYAGNFGNLLLKNKLCQ